MRRWMNLVVLGTKDFALNVYMRSRLFLSV